MDGYWKLNGSSIVHRDGIVLVLGKVKYSFAASKPPLQPYVLVHSNNKVLVGHCTYMAGLAETCPHVGSVLYWLELKYYLSLQQHYMHFPSSSFCHGNLLCQTNEALCFPNFYLSP